MLSELQCLEGGIMKEAGKIDYDINKEQKFRNNYSFLENDFRIQQIRKQEFVVPWQMVEDDKKKVLVE